MAQFYKVLKADPLGDPYVNPNVPNAKPVQSYWCQVEGQEKAVMIGKQVRDDGQVALRPGQHVYGDLMYAKSQKGNEYFKFKSAQVPEGVQRPADSPAQATAQAAVGGTAYAEKWAEQSGEVVPKWAQPMYNMVTYIYEQMKAMDGDALNDPKPATPVDNLGGEEVDEETKSMLDDIFTPPSEVPEDK